MKTSSASFTIAFVTVGMLAAVACGKPSKDEKAGETDTTAAAVGAAKASCDMTGELGSCNEYENGSTFGLEKSLCEGFKGKFALTPCPTSGQIGWCALEGGEVKRYYGASAKDHAYTLDEAKGDCESDLLKGKFTADPSAPAPGKATAPANAAPAKPAAKAATKKK